MFGILTPPALRAAQWSAIFMVEGIIPRLMSLDAEMREVEISVRRARKHLARKKGRDAVGMDKAECGVQGGERMVV
jgi:coiled-coil domain-containing protein 115